MAISRRELFLVGAATGIVNTLDMVKPQDVEAQTSWINWGYQKTGIPEGNDGEIKPLAMVSSPENLVVATMGKVDFTDKAGDKAEWPAKDNVTYLIFNEGEGISVGTWAKNAWVGVTAKPNGAAPLTPGQLTELISERAGEIRKYQPNTRVINVLWVKEGLINFTGTFRVR